MGERYAARLASQLERGILNGAPDEETIKDLLRSYAWRASPIPGHYDPWRGGEDHVRRYRSQAAEGFLLPFEGTVCIEDEISAVFLRNACPGERRIQAMDYRSNSPGMDMICLGNLELVSESEQHAFFVPDTFSLYRIEEKAIRITHPFVVAAGKVDLVQSAITAIRQLAYLDGRGAN